MTVAEAVTEKEVSREEMNGNSGRHLEECCPFETPAGLGPSVMAGDPETMEVQLLLSH